MNHLHYLIIDMDGVLWRGNTPMPGLVDFFDALQQQQIGYVLATNNASKTPAQYVTRLESLGIAVSPAQILTSAVATGDYLGARYPADTAVFVVGDDGLRQAMSDRRFRILTVSDILGGQRADIVVVGFWRQVTYDDFAAATICLKHGAEFVGTNPDVTFPSEWGQLPGAGSFLALLQAATGLEPTVIGKPGRIMFEEALRRLGSTPENTAMVGDRLNTDIAGAKAAGLHTILVLSGIATRESLAQTGGDRQPDFVFADISELAGALKRGTIATPGHR